METEIYPLTIIKDRYNGVYSGGSWTAWNTDFFAIPQEIEGDDVTCGGWWNDFDNGKVDERNAFGKKICVGRGSTPEKAVFDLEQNVAKNNVA